MQLRFFVGWRRDDGVNHRLSRVTHDVLYQEPQELLLLGEGEMLQAATHLRSEGQSLVLLLLSYDQPLETML